MANEQNTNTGVPGTAATVENIGGTVAGATIGYVLAGGTAAVASMLFPPFAPVAIAATPGLGALIGGWIGYKATKPK